jgi:formamidopyrimidine-DNA glycosylase
MPELPEVESLRQILRRSVIGRIIVGARIGRLPLRRKAIGNFAARIRGRRIERIDRRAKYLITDLDGDDVILVHLGMSGSLTHRALDFDATEFDPRHDHVVFKLDDGSQLVFNDPRRFGIVRLVAREALLALPELKGLGPEPLSAEFNTKYLAEKARARKVAIKNLIMDQKVVAGVGNIYASEVLFLAGVRPTRPAGRVKVSEIAKIAEFIPMVLRAAINGRGTTFRNYRDSQGRPGTFADRLQVYGRESEKCYRCSTSIKNVVVGQRASFYCPKCQK